MGQGQELCDDLEGLRKVGDGEKGPAEHEHGGEKTCEVEVEVVDVLHIRRREKGDSSEEESR